MRALQFGVTVHDREKAFPSLTLIEPAGGQYAYLVDMLGQVRNSWSLPGRPSNYAQLLPGGNLLTTIKDGPGPAYMPRGGKLLEFDWEGNVVWEHGDPLQHHDFGRKPNGNTYYLAYELIPTGDCKVQGGIPGSEHEDGGIYHDVLREVDSSGKIVWEWRMADHFPFDEYPLRANRHREEFAHANTCHLQADGNFLISWRDIDVIAEIDGQSGKMLWHKEDRTWGGQHDPRRLENGNITLFANGSEQVNAEYSRVLELDPETWETVWSYSGSPLDSFFSPRISGAHRLPNGNTNICEGRHGRVFEVTPGGEIVWEYISPFQNTRAGTAIRHLFRGLKYAEDSAEIDGRIKLNA